MRYRPELLALAAGALAAAIISTACGGSNGGGAPSTTPNLSAASHQPVGSGSTSPSPSSPAGGPSVIDLDPASAMSTIYAASDGDLRSDQPGLATGDVDGDGIEDIVVGARFADGPNGRTDSGAAYVILGSASPPTSIDLAKNEQDVILFGAAPGDNLGYSALAADLNGDGVKDIVLGAPFAVPPDQTTRERSTVPGAVYVLFGHRGLPGAVDLASQPADVTIIGSGDNGFFGDSLAAGDVNGDGSPDLIVGAPFDSYQPSPESSIPGGSVHVFFGQRQWPSLLSAADSDTSLYAADEFDELGDFVTSGDINGDAVDDVIATAEAADGPDNSRNTAAEVHVLFGRPGLKGRFEIARGQQDLSVYGANTQDTLGFSLATGDMDGDGIGDLVMGARLASSPGASGSRAGQVYVLYGSRQLPGSIDLAQPPDFVAAVYGAASGTLLGSCVIMADVDSDGRKELVMGTGYAQRGMRAEAGAVFITSQPARGSSVDTSGAILRTAVYGAEAGDHLGANVAAADFNGDGRLELVTIAEAAAGPAGTRPGAGRVYILSLSD